MNRLKIGIGLALMGLAWRGCEGIVAPAPATPPKADEAPGRLQAMRLFAGFLLDCHAIPGVNQWALFFHGSGPRTEDEGDFDRNASIGVSFAPQISDFLD